MAGRALIKGITGGVSFQPHLEEPDDGRGLPGLIVEEPEKQLRSGDFTGIPLLTGTTKHETAKGVSLNTINSIFGSVDQFLGSLGDSLKLLTGLLRVDAVTKEITKPILPGLAGALTPTLDDVLSVPSNLNVGEVLSKVGVLL